MSAEHAGTRKWARLRTQRTRNKGDSSSKEVWLCCHQYLISSLPIPSRFTQWLRWCSIMGQKQHILKCLKPHCFCTDLIHCSWFSIFFKLRCLLCLFCLYYVFKKHFGKYVFKCIIVHIGCSTNGYLGLHKANWHSDRWPSVRQQRYFRSERPTRSSICSCNTYIYIQ